MNGPATLAAVVALAVLASGCNSSNHGLRCTRASESSPMLGETFSLRYHDAAVVDGTGLSLRFAALNGDSRCPSGVQCVWEGDAEVTIEAGSGGESVTFELHTHDSFDTEASFANYRIELIDVVPYPEQDQSIAVDDYCVSLRVDPEALP